MQSVLFVSPDALYVMTAQLCSVRERPTLSVLAYGQSHLFHLKRRNTFENVKERQTGTKTQ